MSASTSLTDLRKGTRLYSVETGNPVFGGKSSKSGGASFPVPTSPVWSWTIRMGSPVA